MLPTQTRFAAASAKGTGLPPFDGRAGPHETVKRPTAWTTRKAGLKGIAPVYGWPITLALVGTGALYLYSRSGKMENDLAQQGKNPVFASPKESKKPILPSPKEAKE
ncbi:hypothetical protein JCM8202_004761 [Rhodotorula sphaerocarpa]